MPAELTPDERQVAEAYAVVLDYVSRCALAVDDGDWFYLYDKAAQQLSHAAQQLSQAAQQLSQAAHAGHQATPRPRAAAVRAWVADRCQRAGFRAGELLHPVERPAGGGATAAERLRALTLPASAAADVDQPDGEG